MAQPAYLTASDTSSSTLYVPNLHVTPFNIGLVDVQRASNGAQQPVSA